MAHHPGAPADSHGRLQVGEAGHQDVHFGGGALARDLDELAEGGADQVQLAVEPEAGVGGNLGGRKGEGRVVRSG